MTFLRALVVVVVLLLALPAFAVAERVTVAQARHATLRLVERSSLNGWHSRLRCDRHGCRTRIDVQAQAPGLYVRRQGLAVRSVVSARGGRVVARWTFRLADLNEVRA